MKHLEKLSVYTVLVGCVIAVDRVTKQWAITYGPYTYHHACVAFDVVYNRGISWGLLHGSECYQFMLVSGIVVVITALVVLHAFVWFRAQRSIIGHVLIIAGSISNIADRYWYGGVVDFIHLSYKDWSWAIFNVADIAIVVGALMIAFQSLWDENVATPM